MTKEGLAEIALGGAWLVGIGASARIVELLVAKNPLMGAALGAILVDLAAGRAGVRWAGLPGAPGAPRPASLGAAAREIGLGLALALAATAAAVSVSSLAGWSTARAGAIVSGIPFGAARAAAVGVRDELLYRGVVLLFAARAGLSRRAGVVYGALAGGAAVALAPGSSPGAVVAAVAAGLAFGTLWVTRRGALPAVAAHAGWNLFAGAGVHGALLDVAFARGDLGDGVRAAGGPAFVAAAAWTLVAVLTRARCRR